MATANIPITGSLERRQPNLALTLPKITSPTDLATTGDILGKPTADAAKAKSAELEQQLQTLEQQKADLLKKQLEYQSGELERVQTNLPAVRGAGIVSSAYQAGQAVQPTTSKGSANLQTLGAGIEGATTGAMLAGFPGAVAGGLVGLVSGGITAYTGLKAAREERRRQDKDAREIRRLNERARRDQLQQIRFNQQMAEKSYETGKEQFEKTFGLQREQLGLQEKKFQTDVNQMLYARKIDRLKSRWDLVQNARNQFNSLLDRNENLKQMFINRAR